MASFQVELAIAWFRCKTIPIPSDCWWRKAVTQAQVIKRMNLELFRPRELPEWDASAPCDAFLSRIPRRYCWTTNCASRQRAWRAAVKSAKEVPQPEQFAEQFGAAWQRSGIDEEDVQRLEHERHEHRPSPEAEAMAAAELFLAAGNACATIEEKRRCYSDWRAWAEQRQRETCDWAFLDWMPWEKAHPSLRCRSDFNAFLAAVDPGGIPDWQRCTIYGWNWRGEDARRILDRWSGASVSNTA